MDPKLLTPEYIAEQRRLRELRKAKERKQKKHWVYFHLQKKMTNLLKDLCWMWLNHNQNFLLSKL